jgi:membrane protein CcdC involved in cytochrome C biogenesis
MSLKAFHVFFISVSVLLCLVVGGWGIQSFITDSNAVGILVGLFFIILGFALVVYELRFLRKFKNVSYL